MSKPTRLPFLFHASALALSGHITRPLEHVIEVQAGTSLPTSGGHGSARVENFRFDQMVSFKAGYSQVSGSEKLVGGQVVEYTTLSTAVVEGLNILDVVTADRVVARLSSSFELTGDKDKDRYKEARILTIGSKFDNLQIAGCKIDVVLDHKLAAELDTFAKAKEKYENDPNFKKIVDDPFNEGKTNAKIESHGVIHCSLVKKFDPAECPGICKHHGHAIVVPDFGKIYLAEVLFQYGRKTLTMLRVELGSPNGGGVTAGQADSNGRPPGGGN